MTPVNSIGVILNITMKYSTTIFSQKNNMLFVIENEHFKLGVSVEKGKVPFIGSFGNVYFLILFAALKSN